MQTQVPLQPSLPHPAQSTPPTEAAADEGLIRHAKLDHLTLGVVIAGMLLLTWAICSLSFAEHQQDLWWNRQRTAAYGLLAVVWLFSFLSVLRQYEINKLRAQLEPQLQMIAALQMRAEMLHDLAILDSLTNLTNRRFAMERLCIELARSERYGTRLTVMALDLNGLKRINDRHGHQAGDRVLQEFAAALRNTVRNSDLAARIGGDEFLLILPQCDPAYLPSVLERLSHHEVQLHNATIEIYFAAGWVEYITGESAEAILERADRELYKDKRTPGPETR